MEQELITTATTFGVIYALIELIKYIINRYTSGTKKDDKIIVLEGKLDVMQERVDVLREKLEKIETNDLAHINAKLDINATEHREVFVKLTEIVGLLKK